MGTREAALGLLSLFCDSEPTTAVPREETRTLALLLADGSPAKVASLYHSRDPGFVSERPAARRHEKLEVHTHHTHKHTHRGFPIFTYWFHLSVGFFVSCVKKEIKVLETNPTLRVT